jgi:hypothetical protein
MSSGRFASLCEAELKQITGGKDAKSTNNSTKYAVKTFRTYLKDNNIPTGPYNVLQTGWIFLNK